MFFRKKEAEGGSSAASGGPAAAAGTVTVSMTVNGKTVSADIDPRTLLVQFLRENLRLTGTHVGCDTSQCGACVVHLDGRAVKSCTMLAATCDGAKVTTIEGLAQDGKLHPMQEAFREHHGLQCGFCTPGMIMAAVDIVNRKGGKRRRGHHPRTSSKAISAAARAITTSLRRCAPAPPPWAACARLPNSRRVAPSPHTSGTGHHRTDVSGGDAMSATGIGAPVTPQGRSALHHRQGPVHRRHQSSRARPMRCSCAPRTPMPTSSASTPARP